MIWCRSTVLYLSCATQCLTLVLICNDLQVLSHEWVTDCGRLPAVPHFRESNSQGGAVEALAKEQHHVLTALKKQVRRSMSALHRTLWKLCVRVAAHGVSVQTTCLQAHGRAQPPTTVLLDTVCAQAVPSMVLCFQQMDHNAVLLSRSRLRFQMWKSARTRRVPCWCSKVRCQRACSSSLRAHASWCCYRTSLNRNNSRAAHQRTRTGLPSRPRSQQLSLQAAETARPCCERSQAARCLQCRPSATRTLTLPRRSATARRLPLAKKTAICNRNAST